MPSMLWRLRLTKKSVKTQVSLMFVWFISVGECVDVCGGECFGR